MKIHISWKINLIQQIRLIHALAESNYDITVRADELWKFSELVSKYKIDLSPPCTNDYDISKDLLISHSEPRTSISQIERPLIFPHDIVEECRRIWSPERLTQVGFLGLITPKRAKLITDWVRANTNVKSPPIPNPNSFINTVIRKIKRKLNLPTGYIKQIGPLALIQSNRGRVFPIKAWDQKYFESLGRTKFTLCLSGDCIWSYRFFEATLCGSIPIVEENCKSYEGYKFYSFGDRVDSLNWNEETALHNFEVSKKNLTINKSILNREISELIERKG